MDRAVSIRIGEVLHDHFGEYLTIQSGDVQSDVIDNQILKDTMVGENADDNIIVNFGLTDKSPYLWVCYNSRESEDGTSLGRSHAIYTDCSWDALYLFNALLNYQFADSVLSHKIASGEMAIPERRIIDLSGVNNETIHIDSGLLSVMIPYMLKKRRNRFSNFLYIIVPDSVTDYQRYCIAAITTIFNSIPLGLRKQFKIATNAAEDNEENYHILFCRESVFSRREKKGNAVYLDSTDIPKFMQNDVKNDRFMEFIKGCVANPQYSENDFITECYDEMEKYKTNILSLGEDDYIDFFDNIRLCLGFQEGNITSELLKQCNVKLGSDITENEKEILKSNVCAAISDVSLIEKAIDEDAEESKTFDDFFALLNQCKHVILCLQEKNIFLSQNFMWDKLADLRKNIEDNYVSPEPQSAKAQDLCKLQTLKAELENNKSNFDLFFGADAINSFSNVIDESIKKYRGEYQQESEIFLEKSIRQFENSGSPELLLKGLCSNVNNLYPELMKSFCCDIMQKISQNCDKYEGKIWNLICIIKNYCNDIEVSGGLYGTIDNEIQNHIYNVRVYEKDIDNYINLVLDFFGNDKQKQFLNNLLNLFILMCKEAKRGIGWCSKLEIESIPFYKYRSVSKELDRAINDLIHKNIIDEINQIIESSDMQTVDKLNKSLQDSVRYLDGNTEFQSEMADVLFKNMKGYNIRTDVDKFQKKKLLSYLWEFMNDHCIVSQNMKIWYENEGRESSANRENEYGKERVNRRTVEQKNSNIRERRYNSEKIDIKTFSSYLYACKYEFEIVQRNDINKVISNYKDSSNDNMWAKYSVAQFMSAVLFVEDDNIQNLIENRKNDFDPDLDMYSKEFNGFCKKERIPIVISEKSDIAEIFNEARTYAYLRQMPDDNVIVRYFDKKNKNNDIKLPISQLIYILDDINLLRNGVGNENECFDINEIKDENYYNIWKLLIDLGIIKEEDINNLKKHYGNRKLPKNIDRIIKYYGTHKRNALIFLIAKFVLALFVACILLGTGFYIGYKVKGTNSSKIIEETENSDEDIVSNEIGVPIDTTDSTIDESNADSTEIKEDYSEKNETVNEENDSDITSEFESDTDNTQNSDKTDSEGVSSDTSETESGSEGNIESNEETSTENNDADNINADGDSTTSDAASGEKENISYGKLKTTYSKVKIYSDMQEDPQYMIACVQKREDITVIICDENYSADANIKWVKIQFIDDYTDNGNRTVLKGTEGYVSGDNIIPIE